MATLCDSCRRVVDNNRILPRSLESDHNTINVHLYILIKAHRTERTSLTILVIFSFPSSSTTLLTLPSSTVGVLTNLATLSNFSTSIPYLSANFSSSLCVETSLRSSRRSERVAARRRLCGSWEELASASDWRREVWARVTCSPRYV